MKTAQEWFEERPRVITREACIAWIQNIQIDAFCASELARAEMNNMPREARGDEKTVDRPYEALARAMSMGVL